MNGPIEHARRSRTPIVRNRRPNAMAREGISAGKLASGKDYVVYRDGYTFAGDPVACDIEAYADLSVAIVHAQALTKTWGRCWVEDHSGAQTKARVVGGWVACEGGCGFEVDVEAGPLVEQLR